MSENTQTDVDVVDTETSETPETPQTAAPDTAAAEGVEVHELSESALGHGGDRNYRKVRQGFVVSDKMDKTIVVLVEDRVKHALYGKVMRRSEKVKAHDAENTAGIGDRVLIMETRPLSATKRWRLVEILEKAK